MRKIKRLPVVLLVAFVSCSLAPPPVAAVPLQAGLTTLQVDVLPGYPEHQRTEAFALGVDFISDIQSRTAANGSTWTGGSIVGTSGGANPTATARAFGRANGLPGPGEFFQGSNGIATGLSFLSYYAQIVELNAPPVAVPPDSLPLTLPVTVSVHAEAMARANAPGNSALGIGRALVGGLLLASVVAFESPGCENCQGTLPDAAFDGDVEMSFLSGQVIPVFLQTNVGIVASSLGTVGFGFAMADVSVDPVFSFNQEAFDEIARAAGFPTFDLNQYFAFEFSPGFAPDDPPPPAPVPAPSSAALIGAAVLAAAGALVRRRTGSWRCRPLRDQRFT